MVVGEGGGGVERVYKEDLGKDKKNRVGRELGQRVVKAMGEGATSHWKNAREIKIRCRLWKKGKAMK